MKHHEAARAASARLLHLLATIISLASRPSVITSFLATIAGSLWKSLRTVVDSTYAYEQSYDLLIQSIERQLEVVERGDLRPGEHEGVLCVDSFGPTYVAALRDLLRLIKNGERLSPYAPAYWKILALSGQSQCFVDHEYLIRHGQDRDGIQGDSTSSLETAFGDLWNHPEVMRWKESTTSRVLHIHGLPNAMAGLRLVSAHLASRPDGPPVAYLGTGLCESVVSPYDGQRMSLEGPQMLRHLAIQLLRLHCATFEYPAPSIGDDIWKLLVPFSSAESEQDWFGALEILLPWFSSLDIVLDVGPDDGGQCQWLEQFERLIDGLGECDSRIRVLLISPEPSQGSTNKPSIISIGDTPICSPENALPDPNSDHPPLSASPSWSQDPFTANGTLEPISRPRTRHDFAIAIFCSPTVKLDLIKASLARLWDIEEYGQAPGDENLYILGQTGGLNVVFVQLPKTGKVAAAIAAASCGISFTGIKLAMIVGTCSGVPNARNERVLGDVVISEGLVQYDFGRQYVGEFVRKSSPLDNLPRPRPQMRSLLAKLKIRRAMRELQDDAEILLHVIQGRMGLQEVRRPDSQQMAPNDAPSADNNRDVNNDDNEHEDARGKPSIHIGLFGTGDSFIQSAEARDRIANEEGVIAFETEGAGVWEDFLACVVIKGIADYADGRDDNADAWTEYAACSAMAGALSFLRQWDQNGGLEQ